MVLSHKLDSQLIQLDNLFQWVPKIQFCWYFGRVQLVPDGTAYADNDCLVELGTLNVDAPDDLVTPSKIFIHRALIGITTIKHKH